MSVERKSGGRWQARWRDPAGRQRARTFDRKIDADRFLASVTVDTLRGAYVDPSAGRVTLGDWWATWSATRPWSAGTRERYDGAWRRQIEPQLGDTPLARILHSDLQGLLTSSGLAPSGQALVRSVLVAMLGAAVKDKLIASSPAVGLRVGEVAPDDPRPLSDAEIDALLGACDVDRDRVWLLTGLGTGVRISESLAIRTDKVDFLRRELHVDDQARTPKAGPVELAPLKTARRQKSRTIPLTDSLVAELGRHVEATIPLDRGRRDGLLFPAAGGGLMRRGTATDRFAAIVRRAGLDGVTWHCLRDTAATTMLRGGLNPAYVAKVIGNTVPVLLTRYAGVLPDDVDRAREALERITARGA